MNGRRGDGGAGKAALRRLAKTLPIEAFGDAQANLLCCADVRVREVIAR
jgi:hypothetical protein